jgi:hypothetical protein
MAGGIVYKYCGRVFLTINMPTGVPGVLHGLHLPSLYKLATLHQKLIDSQIQRNY